MLSSCDSIKIDVVQRQSGKNKFTISCPLAVKNYLRLVGFIQGFFTLPVGQSGLIFCNIQNIFYVGQRENESHFQYKIKIFE